MTGKSKKQKKQDLLEMSATERIKLLRTIRESLQQKVMEEKLWKSLANSEKLMINGQTMNFDSKGLKGLSISDMLRGL